MAEWTDPAAELPEDAVGPDRLLTNVSVYWFTGTAGSSAQLSYEMGHDPSAWAPKPRGTVPTGVAVALATDVAIRRFAERDHDVTHWSELERGGNFLSMEQPAAFVREVTGLFDGLAGCSTGRAGVRRWWSGPGSRCSPGRRRRRTSPRRGC
ncbi:hypothetical protein [Streptomyces sp. NPDC060194]|uniref:hypothetical protein n=1 Tax=Streptomyces sp. NPDC060194 TaxID=3347069 RepID=UPI0036681A30